MNKEVSQYLSEIGRNGGRKSRRTLSSVDARNMVRVREARRAFRRFYVQCFWSFQKDFQVTLEDIPWVVSQLRKNGNRETWELAARLCR